MPESKSELEKFWEEEEARATETQEALQELEVYEEEVDAEGYFEAYQTEAQRIVQEMGLDLEEALNYIRQYLRVLDMVQAPDPNGVYVKLLLQKYDMHHKPSETQITVPDRKQLEDGDGPRDLPA